MTAGPATTYTDIGLVHGTKCKMNGESVSYSAALPKFPLTGVQFHGYTSSSSCSSKAVATYKNATTAGQCVSWTASRGGVTGDNNLYAILSCTRASMTVNLYTNARCLQSSFVKSYTKTLAVAPQCSVPNTDEAADGADFAFAECVGQQILDPVPMTSPVAQEGSSGGYFVRAVYSSSRCGQASPSSSSSSSGSVDKDSLPLYYSVESFSTDKCLAPGPMNMYGAPVRLSCRVGKNKVTLVREKYRPTDATCALPPDSETIHAHDVNCVKDSSTKLFEKTVCGALPPGLASAEQVLFKSFDDPSCSNNGETRSVIMNKCALAPGADPYRFKLSYAGTSGSSLLVQETRFHKEDTGCQGQVVESSVLKVVDGVCQRDPTRPTGFVNRVSWLGSSSSAAALPAWFAAPLSVTAPTVPPTAAPSAPSPRPTRATSRPTRPTARPTVRPTPKPTTATPSALPSAQPTQAPTYTTVIGEGHALCDLWSQQSAATQSTLKFTNWCGATNSAGVYTNGPCSTTNAWAGVTCSSFGGVGRVVKIVLSGASLTGTTLPPSLGSLLQLTYLDLSSNSLAGSIPATLAALTNLQYLALNSNSLVGSIPASVASSLSALTYLSLYSNSLVGAIPATMGFISRVKSLLLSSNKMTGAVPESICGVNASIASITLNDNYFSGCYPACLNVIKTFVSPTGSGVGPCFSATDGDANALCDLYAKFLSTTTTTTLGTKLTNWDCTNANKGPYGNFISGPCSTSKAWFGVTCSAVNGALRVTKLDVKGNTNNLNANSAPIPASIGNMDAMTWLNISSCSFGGKIPVTLGSMADLNHLEIQSNKLTGTLPMALSRLSDMTSLSFDTNSLAGPLPAQVLAAMPGLKKLVADNNRFTGTIPAVLGQLVQLNYLKVKNNLLVGSIPFQLCNLPKGIGTLDFTSNPSLTCYAPCLSVSSGYANLKVDAARTPCYSLSDSDGVALCNLLTKVTDTSSPAKLSTWTAGCASKKNSTFLTGPCSTGASAWTGVGCTTTDSVSRVSSLVLRNMGATFKASLPSLIGSLTALTRLDLFSSSFESSLPTELGMLSNLASLQLGGNRFTKSVPSQLASLKSLTLLGLASNSLTGRLPAGLWWLTKLNQLSLDRNRFSGPISPNIGQLTGLQGLSLGANSFAGVVPGQVCNLNQTVASHLDVSGNSGLTCMPACITGGGVSSSIMSMRSYYSDASWNTPVWGDNGVYVFSLAFTTSVDIYITAVQFYKITGYASSYSAGAPIQAAIYVTTGQTAGNVYTGTKVGGTVTFTSQSASGWQTQALPKPVKVAAGSGVVIALNYPFNWYQSANSGVFTQTAVGPFTDIHSQSNPDQARPMGYPILPTTRQTTNRLIDFQFSLYADLLPSCMPYKYPYPSTTNLAYLTGVALSGTNIPLGTIASLQAQYTVTFDYMPQTAYTTGDNRNILTLAVAGSIYGMAGSAIPRVMYSPKGYFLSQSMTSAMAPWIDVVSSGGSRGDTPISLIGSTNLALWLDASDTAAFSFSGTTVTQWQSSSTPMVTFMPDTGSGNAGWSATGLGGVAPGVQMMNKGFKSTTNPALPPTGDYTVVYVGTMGSTASTSAALFDHGDKNTDVVWERNAATGNVQFQSNSDTTGCNLAFTADSPMILIGTNTGGVKRDVYSINSALVRASASCTNTYSMNTGAAFMRIGESDVGDYSSGVVSEIIYYQRVLSASEISTLQTYLINKWFSWTNHAWLSPTQPMPVNLWTSFSITMDFQKAVFSFAASNGTNIARQLSAMPTPSQTTWSNVNVYACFVGADSSTATSFSCGQGLIRNIYITSGISVALPTVLPLFMFPGPANGFLAAQNQILGVVNLPAQYSLNFDFFPTTDSDSGFRMMLCLTVAPLSLRGVPSGESFNGARLPCVGFANAAAYGTYNTLGSKKTGFSANTPVLSVLTTPVNDAWDPSLPLPGALPKNAWTSFVVKVDFLNLVKSIATTGGVINAVASAPMELPPQSTWKGVYIMAPNGLATAASGYLRNVAVAPMTVKVPVVQPLLSLPGSAYSVFNAGWPKITLSQQIGTVSLPQQFTVTLDVYLNQQASAVGPFYSCAFALYDGPFSASVRLLGLYFVASTGASNAGLVLPSGYSNSVFPDESRSATAYSRIATMQDAPSKQWTSYSITKDFVNSAWSVATSGGVAIPRTVIRALPYQSALSGVTVWATQPGSAPVADGYVRNIVISSGVAAAVPPLPAVLPLLNFPGPSTGLPIKAGCSFGQMSLPAQYTVSFDFMPTAHNGNVKTSFFLLSVVGALGIAGNVGGLTGNVGDASTAGGRMLAYYLAPNSTAVGSVLAGTFPSLSPMFETNIATTECFSYSTTPLALNAWSTFTATMDVTNSVVTSTVSGATTIGPASLLFNAPTTTTFAGQAVSADPTTGVTAATGWLRNVLIVATPIATPVYPGAGPSDTSQLFKQTFSSIGSLLASNTVMGTITSLPAQYTLTFDFLPLSDGTGWRNIITMAQQGVTAGSAGFRLPAVHLSAGCDWVLNNVPQCQYPTLSVALSIAASGSNSVGLIGLANKARLPLSQFATFSIYVDLTNAMVSWTVSVAGAVLIKQVSAPLQKPVPTTFSNVDVQACGSSLCASGYVRNLIVRRGVPMLSMTDDGDFQVQGWNPTAAPTPVPPALPNLPFSLLSSQGGNMSVSFLDHHNNVIPSTQGATSVVVSFTLANANQSSSALFNIAVASAATANVLAVGGGGMAAIRWGGGGGGGAVYTAPLTMRPGYNFMINVGAGGRYSPPLSMSNLFTDGSFSSSTPGQFVAPYNMIFSLAFTTTSTIYITAVKFYKYSGRSSTYDAATRNAVIFVSTGQTIGGDYGGTQVGSTITFTGETASGWQTQALPSPIKVAAGSGVVIAVNFNFDACMTPSSFSSTSAGPFTDIHSQYDNSPSASTPPVLPPYRQEINRMIDFVYSLSPVGGSSATSRVGGTTSIVGPGTNITAYGGGSGQDYYLPDSATAAPLTAGFLYSSYYISGQYGSSGGGWGGTGSSPNGPFTATSAGPICSKKGYHCKAGGNGVKQTTTDSFSEFSGGGGGAGTTGLTALGSATTGAGGAGRTWKWTGPNVFYGAGGGGASAENPRWPFGGPGGNGVGGDGASSYGRYSGGNGRPNTGSGGGSNLQALTSGSVPELPLASGSGGMGGSGVVRMQFPIVQRQFAQTFSAVNVTIFGMGGGGGFAQSNGQGGHGGAFTAGMALPLGSSFHVVVGSGGQYRPELTDPGFVGGDGWGGAAAPLGYGAQGGGLSGIFSGSGAISQATAVLIAGGGGGGGWNGYPGGGGGGTLGNTADGDGGRGASQTSPGLMNDYFGSDGWLTDGTPLQGGSWAQRNTATTRNCDFGGGSGGGGGYFGGGSGGNCHNRPGGGGSGFYTTSPWITWTWTPQLCTGANSGWSSSALTCDTSKIPWPWQQMLSPFPFGQGGTGSKTNGISGAVIIQYPLSYPPLITAGAVIVTTDGQNRIYKFTSSGSFTYAPDPVPASPHIPQSFPLSLSVWGGGGGAWGGDSNVGGTGGVARGVLIAGRGQAFNVVVGGGGVSRAALTDPGPWVSGYGGLAAFKGGCAQGGGLSGIFSGSGAISQATAVLIAGGGGGSGYSGGGGAGGGAVGDNGQGSNSGTGATQTTGGSGGNSQGGVTDGQALQGGSYGQVRDNGDYGGGGGGGGGYWGGGSGFNGDSPSGNSGGGGGSGYASPVLQTSELFSGSSTKRLSLVDPQGNSWGLGGLGAPSASFGYQGGAGAVVVQYPVSFPPFRATTGAVTVVQINGMWVYTWTSNGSFTI